MFAIKSQFNVGFDTNHLQVFQPVAEPSLKVKTLPQIGKGKVKIK